MIGTFESRDPKYGVAADGVTDDAPALQAWIDDALGPGDPATTVRNARGPLYLSPGVYAISKPLRITSAQFVTFHGAGGSSRIGPIGDLPSILDINGVAYSTFRDFAIVGGGSNSATDAIAYYWDPATAARSSTRNVFEAIMLGCRCVTGLRAGKPGTGVQVDTTSYRDLWFGGSWAPGETTWWQNGLYIGDDLFANNLCHWGYGLAVDHWANGVVCAASTWSQWGGNFGANGIDFLANTLAGFSVQALRSEASGRLLVSGGPGGNTATYHLEDIVWHSAGIAPDLEFIRMKMPGALVMTSLQVQGTAPVKLASWDTLGLTLKLTGVVTPNTLDGFLPAMYPRTAAISEGYYQATDSGQVDGTPGPVTNAPLTGMGADGGAVWWKGGKLLARPRKSTNTTTLAKP